MLVLSWLVLSTTPAAAQTTVDAVDVATQDNGDLTLELVAEGLVPNDTVFLVLCNPGVELVDYETQCSLIGTGVEGYVVDGDGTLAVPELLVPSGPVGVVGATCPTSDEQRADGIVCLIAVVDASLRPMATARLDRVDDGTLELMPPSTSLARTGLPARTVVMTAIGLGAIFLGGLNLAAARHRQWALATPLGPIRAPRTPTRTPSDLWNQRIAALHPLIEHPPPSPVPRPGPAMSRVPTVPCGPRRRITATPPQAARENARSGRPKAPLDITDLANAAHGVTPRVDTDGAPLSISDLASAAHGLTTDFDPGRGARSRN